ncbi:MAG: hypothetical protein ACTSR8_15850 [Promethearchaeota archaeon]
MLIKDTVKYYDHFKQDLNLYPFTIIIGKYDHILGPRVIYSTTDLKEEEFIHNLLRDALNTKNKYVILDFNKFYAQVCKTEVEDPLARGGKQLYAIILLRHADHPIIPIVHLKRIEMLFHSLGTANILLDENKNFDKFCKQVKAIYLNKNELLPLESLNLQIRSGLNTIQGFCELILEDREKSTLSRQEIMYYIQLMSESCSDISNALEKQFGTIK